MIYSEHHEAKGEEHHEADGACMSLEELLQDSCSVPVPEKLISLDKVQLRLS
jgi:hypothetical protein